MVGTTGALRLQAIGYSVAGLILQKRPPAASEVLPPRLYQIAVKYPWLYRPRRKKLFATGFPFLKPGIFVTSARALDRVDLADLRTYNNRILSGEVLGVDVASGIGVLRVDAPDLTPLKASELPIRESDLAWAICYPVSVSGERVEYLPESFHRGRVTAVGQQGTNLVAFENLLRTDHTIEDGCVGGAVLDGYGAVAGMILSSPDPGVVYALPISDLTAIVETLSQKQAPKRPYFGIGLVPPDDRRRAKFHLPPDASLPLVAYLIPGSPAQSAGLRPGDLLSAVEGEKVPSVAAAGARLLKAAPGGAPVRLTVIREGKEVTLPVPPSTRPGRILLSPSDEIEETLQANLVEVTTGSTALQGLRVSELVRGGRGERDGYREGDIITAVDGKSMRRMTQFDEIVRAENSHIFSASEGAADSPPISTYQVTLKVRAEKDGEKEDRDYLNYFPDILSPPVY